MRVFANVMVKDEAIILPHVFEYWKDYPVDQWVFFDDNSKDNTVEVINDLFGDKAVVLGTKDSSFSECRNRSSMLEHSRDSGADIVLAIDADELLSANLVEGWNSIGEAAEKNEIQLYWYNVVGNISKIRQDPMYLQNYRMFFISLDKCGRFDMTQYKYHTPRLPESNLPRLYTKEIGVIHLQSINKRFYALKQLWYKHYEYNTWNHPVDYINSRYDPVINNLNFDETDIPESIVGGIEFDASIYDEIEKSKGYKKYILENRVDELVTFGSEYLDG